MSTYGKHDDDEETMMDITAPVFVEVEVRQDGEVLWVHVDGICVTRICQMRNLAVTINDPYHRFVWQEEKDDPTLYLNNNHKEEPS